MSMKKRRNNVMIKKRQDPPVRKKRKRPSREEKEFWERYKQVRNLPMDKLTADEISTLCICYDGPTKPLKITPEEAELLFQKKFVEGKPDNEEVCPVCGTRSVVKEFGKCIECGWKVDDRQTADPDMKNGANKMSLNEAREAWKKGDEITG